METDALMETVENKPHFSTVSTALGKLANNGDFSTVPTAPTAGHKKQK